MKMVTVATITISDIIQAVVEYKNKIAKIERDIDLLLGNEPKNYGPAGSISYSSYEEAVNDLKAIKAKHDKLAFKNRELREGVDFKHLILKDAVAIINNHLVTEK